MLGLAYSGCDYTAAIIFLTAATAVHGAVSTGPLASFIDLSPNYASKYFPFQSKYLAIIICWRNQKYLFLLHVQVFNWDYLE